MKFQTCVKIALLIPLAACLSACEVDPSWTFNPANGHYYKLTSEAAWTGAANEATLQEGYLTTVNDLDEHQ